MKKTLYLKSLVPLLVFLASQLVLTTVFLLVGMSESSVLFLALMVLISGLLSFAILAALRMIRPIEAFRPRRWQWGMSAIAFVGVAAGIFAVDLLSEKAQLPDYMEQSFVGLAHSPLGVLAMAVVGPVVEELVFREGVQGYLQRLGAPLWPALLLGAVAFGIVHMNPAQIPFAMCVGVLLGLVYHRTGNVALTSLIHIANNSVAVIELRILGPDIATFDVQQAMGGPALCWLYIAVAAAVCIGLMRYYWIHTSTDKQ